VVEFIEDPAAYPRDPDTVLKLSPEASANVYLGAGPSTSWSAARRST